MKTQHTPRPWSLFWTYPQSGKASEIRGDGEIGEPIAVIPHDDVTCEGIEEVVANTALILAAPGLREALCELMEAVGDMPADPAECWPEAWAKACAALDEAVPVDIGTEIK